MKEEESSPEQGARWRRKLAKIVQKVQSENQSEQVQGKRTEEASDADVQSEKEDS